MKRGRGEQASSRCELVENASPGGRERGPLQCSSLMEAFHDQAHRPGESERGCGITMRAAGRGRK